MSPWGVGGIGGTIGGHGLTPGQADDLAVHVWELKSEEWITQILGVPLSPQVRKDFADVIHGAVQKHGESPAESIQRQRYNIASSEHGEQVRNAISREFYDRDLTPAEHKALAVKLAEGTKTLAQFRKEAAYSDAARHKIADIFRQEHGFDATQQDLDYGSMKTGDGWSLQDYRWNEAHSDRVASQLQDIITSVQGRPYQDSDAVWVRAKQDSLGTGQQNIQQVRRDLARWTADNGGYDAVFQATHNAAMQASDRNYAADQIGNGWSLQDYRWNEAHSDRVVSQLQDIITSVQGRPYQDSDAVWVRARQDSLGTGQQNIQQIRPDLARWTADNGGYDAVFQATHNTAMQASDRNYAADQIGNGRSVQEYRWNEAHSERAWREYGDLIQRMTNHAPNTDLIRQMQDNVGNGSSLTEERRRIAYSEVGRAAIDKMYLDATEIMPGGKSQYDFYSERFANGASYNDNLRVFAKAWEVHNSINKMYLNATEELPDGESQYKFYSDRIANGASYRDNLQTFAKEWEVHNSINKMYLNATEKLPGGESQYKFYSDRIANGASYRDNLQTFAKEWEVHNSINEMYIRTTEKLPGGESQYKFYSDRIANGASYRDNLQTFAKEWEVHNSINEMYIRTTEKLPGGESQYKFYSDRIANGASYSDNLQTFAKEWEVHNSINEMYIRTTGKLPGGESQYKFYSDRIANGASYRDNLRTLSHEWEGRDAVNTIARSVLARDLSADELSQYQDELAKGREISDLRREMAFSPSMVTGLFPSYKAITEAFSGTVMSVEELADAGWVKRIQSAIADSKITRSAVGVILERIIVAAVPQLRIPYMLVQMGTMIAENGISAMTSYDGKAIQLFTPIHANPGWTEEFTAVDESVLSGFIETYTQLEGKEAIGQLEGMSIQERLPWLEGMTGLSEDEIRFTLIMARPFTPDAQNFPLKGQSQGGPGIWDTRYEGTTDPNKSTYKKQQEDFAYQKRITGAPQDIAYVVKKPDGTEVKFDGYDPNTGALLDAKNWHGWPKLEESFSRASVMSQMQSQIKAAQGREIVWIVPSEETKQLILQLFTENRFDISTNNVQIKVVP